MIRGPFFSLCTSCKGRLDHIKMTLPFSLSHDDSEVLLVDYSCPEHVGDWAERRFSADIRAGRLRVIRVTDRREFHSAHAKNVTHIRGGGLVLVNADADNFIDRAYLDKCRQLFSDPLVQIVHPAPWNSLTATCGMLGRVAIRRQAYRLLGGYDEDLIGWGWDDHDLVARAAGLGFRSERVPHDYLKVIEHDDALRTRYLPNPDKNYSDQRNAQLSRERLRAGELVANRGRVIGEISGTPSRSSRKLL
jgi:hypothetical protein